MLVLLAGRVEAASIFEFDVFAARNVIVGVGTEVGQTTNQSLVGAGTTVVNVGDASLNGTAGIHGDLRAGDDVTLGNNSFVTGTITNPDAFTTGSGVTFGAHVVAEPDLPTLPAATVFSHGVTSQSVANGGTLNLAPGSYLNITLGGAATLNLSAGDYFLNSLTAGNGLTINVDLTGGEVNIFVTDAFSAGGIQAMNLTGGTFQDVNVETHHANANAFRVGGGNGTNWKGNVFTPFGDIHLGSGSSTGLVEGFLWAGRDVDLEHGLVVVPEPTTLAVLAVALGALGAAGRRP